MEQTSMFQANYESSVQGCFVHSSCSRQHQCIVRTLTCFISYRSQPLFRVFTFPWYVSSTSNNNDKRKVNERKQNKKHTDDEFSMPCCKLSTILKKRGDTLNGPVMVIYHVREKGRLSFQILNNVWFSSLRNRDN